MNNTHTRALVRPTFSPTSHGAPAGPVRGFFRAWGQVLCGSLPCPQAHSREAVMEILMVGAWTALIWWVSWATCTALHRGGVSIYSRRLIAWERQARRDAALSHDMERLR